MNLLEKLRRAKESPATAFHLFLQKYVWYDIHCFVEGDDDPSFYRNFVQQYAGNDKTLVFYKCGGKSEVYSIREKIFSTRENRTKQHITLFFVDKDLSDILEEEYPEHEDIYVTDLYSIENYLISSEMLRVTLDDVFNFYEKPFDQFDAIIDQFEQQLEEFHRLMHQITRWVIYCKLEGEEQGLSNVRPENLFVIIDGPRVELNGISENELFDHLEQLTSITAPDNFDEVSRPIQERLAERNPKEFIRGKDEYWFFVEFIHRVQEHLKDYLAEQFSYHDKWLDLRAFVKFFGPRLSSPPDSLREYLEVHFSIS